MCVCVLINQDAEYLYALEKKRTPKSRALQEQARGLATHFTNGWNPGCFPKGSGKDSASASAVSASVSVSISVSVSVSISASVRMSLCLCLSVGIHANGANWGDDGYAVDSGGEADGSSVVNTWRLAMGAELDDAEIVY